MVLVVAGEPVNQPDGRSSVVARDLHLVHQPGYEHQASAAFFVFRQPGFPGALIVHLDHDRSLGGAGANDDGVLPVPVFDRVRRCLVSRQEDGGSLPLGDA